MKVINLSYIVIELNVLDNLIDFFLITIGLSKIYNVGTKWFPLSIKKHSSTNVGIRKLIKVFVAGTLRFKNDISTVTCVSALLYIPLYVGRSRITIF